MREEAEISLDEILSEAGVAEGEELDEQAERVVSMLPAYIDQDDPEAFVTHIREETESYGNEKALIEKVLAILKERGDITEEFVLGVSEYLRMEKEAPVAVAGDDVNEDDDEDDDDEDEDEEEEEMESVKLDLGAEAA